MQSKQLVLAAIGASVLVQVSNVSHEQYLALLHDFESKQAHVGLLCCALAKHG